MKLDVQLDETVYHVEVPDEMLQDAVDFFARMDSDMDQGWQMGMEYIEHPDQTQRCQIVADKLHDALAAENATLAQLMAAYILLRMPGVTTVIPSQSGEMQETDFVLGGPATDVPVQPGGVGKMAAMEQAGKEISKVYKSGRSYRYAVYSTETGSWIESEPYQSQADADASRMAAFRERYENLLRT